MLTLTVRDATFLFNGKAVKIPDFTAKLAKPCTGERAPSLLIIKGKIGSGKTLLLKSLGGAIKPHSGEITLTDGTEPCSGWFVHSQAEFNFVTGIVSDELEFAGVSKAPFTPYLKRNVNEMSGGELKALSVKMALEASAGAVLLDEPLDMLDDEESQKMADYIYSNSFKKPIIIATHDDHFDNLTDNIIYIDSDSAYEPVAPVKSTKISEEIGLKADNLSIQLDGRTFPPVTLKNRKGEILCLFGRNGSGKTLFTRTVAGIGKYAYEGSYSWSEPASRRGICLQFPEQMVYQDTIEREIADCAGAENVASVLNLLNWTDRRKDSPFSLSDGEKRKMYITSMLVKGTTCLFDEPFAGLDGATVNFIVSSFYNARDRGASILYTANRLKDTIYADTTISI